MPPANHPAESLSLYATFTIIDSLVLISTLFRLCFRWHIRRFWWEDAWAAATFVSGTAFVITQYISVKTADHETGFITNLFASVFSTIAMCAVRMSILYSTIRIMPPPSSRMRTFARIVAIFFCIFCATIVALRSFLCTNHKCINGLILLVFQVTTDCVSDAILVILPLKLLWRVKLPRRQRRMILTSFASSAIVSIFSLVHGTASSNNVNFDLTLNLETTSALIVCNLLVLVTYMYRLFHKLRGESVSSESNDSSADDDFTTRTSTWRNTEALTFVDLDIDTSYSGNITSVSSSSYASSAATGKNGD